MFPKEYDVIVVGAGHAGSEAAAAARKFRVQNPINYHEFTKYRTNVL